MSEHLPIPIHMTGERTIDGWELRLKPRGLGRFVSAAFLGVWLCGWAIGEAFALWFLIKGAWALFTGTPPDPGREPLQVGPAVMVGAFLIVWLTIWTFGGVAALSELLRLVWGEDRFVVAGGRLTMTWVRGPFRWTRGYDRDAIRRITLAGRAEHLQLEAGPRRVHLSGLGTRDERVAALETLRSELGLQEVREVTTAILPEGWEEIITPEGERALVKNVSTRRKQAQFASVVTLLLAALAFVLARESVHQLELLAPAILVFAFTVGCTAGTLWLARGRWEWKLGGGGLVLRKRYGGSLRDVFVARRLRVDVSSDSDGDAWYELEAVGDASPPTGAENPMLPAKPRNRRTIVRLMDDPTTVRDLAAWLSRQTGLELEDHSTPQSQEVQLLQLRVALEGSGRFGRWAMKVVDRLGENKRKSG